MHIQPISWHYAEEKKCWVGKTNGILSHVEMIVIPMHSAFQECMINSTISGFKMYTVVGLDNAKQKAQELLNSYAMSLIIL